VKNEKTQIPQLGRPALQLHLHTVQPRQAGLWIEDGNILTMMMTYQLNNSFICDTSQTP
jgi:hypothetical protein